MILHQRSVPLARSGLSRFGGLDRARLQLGALLLLAPLAFASMGLAFPAGAAGEPAISGVVNVNTASAEELQMLPGVGESRAAAIVDSRKARGGFKTVDELKSVKGVGSKLLEKLRPFVTLKGKTTARRL